VEVNGEAHVTLALANGQTLNEYIRKGFLGAEAATAVTPAVVQPAVSSGVAQSTISDSSSLSGNLNSVEKTKGKPK